MKCTSTVTFNLYRNYCAKYIALTRTAGGGGCLYILPYRRFIAKSEKTAVVYRHILHTCLNTLSAHFLNCPTGHFRLRQKVALPSKTFAISPRLQFLRDCYDTFERHSGISTLKRTGHPGQKYTDVLFNIFYSKHQIYKKEVCNCQ